MNNVSINQINNFLSDKEKCSKVMIGTKVFKTFTTSKDNKNKYNDYILTQKNFESSINTPYFNCRIFSVENVALAFDIIQRADANYIFLYRKNLINKYSVIEAEIFISYLNKEFKDIIKYLTLFEYINGKENNNKLQILFSELEKYYQFRV